ncbi:ankyrin repeat-containing protein [Apiospora arundinis]|uniref:Ankyrin repeat-containing protein n=1 Tax=Apiospora arundinis TaxID=335852 RepID=A0ABR2IHY7_9PEZI
MAEVLGAVASGIALAEVAWKAGGAVSKLKRLWNETKNVPETIADLMIQIECLDPAIWEAETHFVHTGLPPELWDDAAARKSANCCRIAL